jgi:hypothetical protein
MASVQPFKASDLAELILQPAQRAWQERITPQEAAHLEQTGNAWTLRTDRVIGCGGVLDRGGGRGEAWALIAQDAGRDMIAATKAVRRYFETAPYRRIEAVTAANFPAAERWVAIMGGRFEGLMEAFCEDGTDAKRWAWVKR